MDVWNEGQLIYFFIYRIRVNVSRNQRWYISAKEAGKML